MNVLRTTLCSLAISTSLTGCAAAITDQDTKLLKCHAAKATTMYFAELTKTAIEGRPLPTVPSADAIKKPLELINSTFPKSQEHLAEFYRYLAEDFGLLHEGLSSGDHSFVETLTSAAEPCKDDYET